MTTLRTADHWQIGLRKQQGKRSRAQDRNPDHQFTSDAVSHWPSDDRSCGNGKREQEQQQLSRFQLWATRPALGCSLFLSPWRKGIN